jgi:peptidoglycan hydrolase CwlO-like protein
MKNQSKSFVKSFLFTIAFLGVMFSIGCGVIRKNQITAELEKLEPQKEASKRRLNEINQKINSLETDAGRLRANIKNRSNLTLGYMKDHFIAVACMASVGYSVGTDNLFSKEVNDAINTSSFLCVLGVIFSEDFRNEVAGVVDTINEADREIKSLQAQIKNLDATLATGYEVRKNEEAVYDSLSTQVASLKSELAQLEGK